MVLLWWLCIDCYSSSTASCDHISRPLFFSPGSLWPASSALRCLYISPSTRTCLFSPSSLPTPLSHRSAKPSRSEVLVCPRILPRSLSLALARPAARPSPPVIDADARGQAALSSPATEASARLQRGRILRRALTMASPRLQRERFEVPRRVARRVSRHGTSPLWRSMLERGR